MEDFCVNVQPVIRDRDVKFVIRVCRIHVKTAVSVYQVLEQEAAVEDHMGLATAVHLDHMLQ